MEVAPLDQHNQLLVANTHPGEWKNPQPSGRYNLVAVGAGSAGIISALGAAGLGGKTALVERRLLGGDCLNYGCVPSKALIRASRAAYEVAGASRFGVRVDGRHLDFGEAMRRLREIRARISHHDSAVRFKSLGVDVYLGNGQFTGHDSLEVPGRRIEFHRAVIATGARPLAPQIPGLEEVGFLTNETFFSLTELPRRLVVIGGGPIGCELGQALRRFGAEVDIIEKNSRILPKEEPSAAAVVAEQIRQEGIHLYLGGSVRRVEKSGDGKRVIIERGREQNVLVADEILVAVGRTPNVENLGLEAGGVEYDTRHGVKVNDRLRTTNPRIFAAGDVCSVYKFTHAADAMARICIQNALFLGRKKLSSLVIPRATYTDPEVAHVGMTSADAERAGVAIDSYREDLADVDRAVLDGEDTGFAVVHARKGTGRVVGATIVARHASEMIGEITLLMTAGKPLGALAETIHSYPAQVEVLKRIADAYRRTKLTPKVAWALKKWLAWRR